jgi:hypothetical protein
MREWHTAAPKTPLRPLILISVQTTPMSTATDTTFNGWANWETWNVALWIQNDESLYDAARRCRTYQDLVAMLYDCGSRETPDGCRWDDPAIDGLEINSMMDDL